MEMAHFPDLVRGQRPRGCMVGTEKDRVGAALATKSPHQTQSSSNMEVGNQGIHPTVTFLVAERSPPADKWSLVQLLLGNPEARTVDDSVSLKRTHRPCFQASAFSVSLPALPPMKKEKKEKRSQVSSSLPVCFLDRKFGNKIPVWHPRVPPDSPLSTPHSGSRVAPPWSPAFTSHVLGKASVLGKVAKRGEQVILVTKI